jgi:GNAT superfamily N-acetyltransferase
MTDKTDFVSGNIDYHKTLNPIAWDSNDKLRSEVQLKLLEIARVFVKYLEIPNFEVLDIVLTGSMANYNYTRYSDFDIHVVTHYANLQSDEIAEAFYRAKKEIWNNQHDIKIRKHEAELYIEDSATPPVSGGVYSILRDEWINKPEYNPPRINNTAVNAKVRDLVRQIAHAIKDGDISDIERIRTKIRNMRRSGLDRAGEFGVENLAFKILRNEGYLDKLHKTYIQLQDRELSLEGRIDEGATSILYHFASIRSALNILNTKHFELSSVTGNRSEEQYAPKDHPYFLSLTRTRVGDYHRYVGSGGVLFVLDGTWFNRNHKVTPIDYWERAWQHSPDRSREAEDRVFSKTPTIPIDSVQEVHVLLKEQDKWRSPEARQLLIASKKSGIETYFYVDEKNWRLLNKAKSISVKDSGGVLSGQMPTKPMYSPERDYLEPWLELIYKNNKADLSDRAEKTRYNLVYYGSRYRNEDSGLGGDLSNARKPDQGASRKSAIKLIDYMMKNGYKSPLELKNFLSDKWEKIAELDQAKTEGVAEADTIELTQPDTKVTDFINAVYTKYPHTMQNNHVMVWGSGDNQQFAMFELVPSFSKRGAVEVKWFQAYPLRQGVGSRAMQELQALAKDAGVPLTLYPWDKGQVSQAKLTKFYKGQGFKPTVKGAKNMAWTPESLDENFADGRNPQDKGDSQRHGIPKGATMAELEKAAKASGRKGQLARWQLNMRRGQKRANESIVTEGGWASVETQNTVITPKTVAEIVETLKGFEKSYNTWQANNGYDTEIKMGNPKGSGTYYRRDLAQDPTREYGDIDVECFIHSRDGVKSAQRITEYKKAITEYCLQSPDYSTENGTNLVVRTTDGPAQVDLLYTYHEHADWSRALSPEYRVKGVISTSLTSALAEVLNLSFSGQGIQVKIRNNQPVSFRQSRDTELRTVSLDPNNWAKDIYSLYYYLAHGEKPTEFPGGLAVHSGLKDEQRLSDIVLAIKSLANALEETNMLGHGALISIPTKQDLVRKVASVYSDKLETAENSSKFDKAQTPAAVEKAKKTKLMLAKYRNEITKLLLN